MLNIKKMTIFTKSVLYCAACCGIAIILLLITMKYVNNANLDITAFSSGNVADKIAFLCYQVISSVFGFSAVSGSILSLFFSYYFFVLIIGAVVVLASFLLFWVSKMIMRIAG